MSGRIIIYIILVSILILMAYVGFRIGARHLVWLSGAGIVFLAYKFFAHQNDNQDETDD
jgi:hypothetical protein